jgi:hypothetical protein
MPMTLLAQVHMAFLTSRSKSSFLTLSGLLIGFALMGAIAQSIQKVSLKVTRVFPEKKNTATQFNESIIANPVLDLSGDEPSIIVPESNGTVSGLNGLSGMLDWQLTLPCQPGQTAQLAATPVQVRQKLVTIFQCLDHGERVRHLLAVIDLRQQQIDPGFPILELRAEKPSADGKTLVKFTPATAYSHAALKYLAKPGTKWGYVYAAFGNAGDIQPFHGWLFEIDVSAWLEQGSNHAISQVLLTTPEAECPVNMEHGTQEMICGGGIWTPPGPQIFGSGLHAEIILPVGNGQIDLNRHDYANTLMRVKPGLTFDPACDAQLCVNFNPTQPDEACLASCKNLFVPRPKEGDKPLRPANRECDDKSFWDCLAWMDYDLGANAPVKATLGNGKSILVQPGKEGAVYLIDADHLGTQYDRIQIVGVCGTATDPCKAGWMGMIVTQPVLTYINREPVVIVPSFVPDNTHPAGITALKIVLEQGKPKFKRFWQFPHPSDKQGLVKFRSHPSFPAISKHPGNGDVVWVVDTGSPGILYGLRIKDGKVLVEQPLLGTGRQLSVPVIHGNVLYLASSLLKTGGKFIEAYRISEQTPDE